MTIVTINSDKTISIDGKKTFFVEMNNICAPYIPSVDCNAQIQKNNNALVTSLTGGLDYADPLKLKLNAAGILFYKSCFQSSEPDTPGMFGYYQPDEPTVGVSQYPITSDMTEQQMLARILSDYTKRHTEDPYHPVMLGHWTKMTKWLPYCDILKFGIYTITYHSWQTWTREDSIYVWEIASWKNYFMGTELNQISKPVYAVISANIMDPSWNAYEPTPQEARANTYTAITLDVKGIEFFGYMVMGNWTNISTITGVYSDPVLADYYNHLMGELRDLNDVLVSKTLDYSWTYHRGNGLVLFSNVYSKSVDYVTTTNFNYILKDSGHLIVVNKDSRPITTTITVPGLSSSTITTIGRETAGSGRSGRALTVTNGMFTDTFDGLAVHIYDLGSMIIPEPPQPPQTQNSGLEKAFAVIGGYLILKAIGVAK